MLEHKKDIKHDGKEAEPQLGGVTKEGAPVVVVVGDDKHLADAEDASSEVEHYVAYAPPDGALAAVVHVGLLVGTQWKHVTYISAATNVCFLPGVHT